MTRALAILAVVVVGCGDETMQKMREVEVEAALRNPSPAEEVLYRKLDRLQEMNDELFRLRTDLRAAHFRINQLETDSAHLAFLRRGPTDSADCRWFYALRKVHDGVLAPGGGWELHKDGKTIIPVHWERDSVWGCR